MLAADKKNCKETCTAVGKKCNKDTIELQNRVCDFQAFEHILQSPKLQLVKDHTYKDKWTTAIVNKLPLMQELDGDKPNMYPGFGGVQYDSGAFVSNSHWSQGAGVAWYVDPRKAVPTDDAFCSTYLPSDTIQIASILCACVQDPTVAPTTTLQPQA